MSSTSSPKTSSRRYDSSYNKNEIDDFLCHCLRAPSRLDRHQERTRLKYMPKDFSPEDLAKMVAKALVSNLQV
jgi:hypothetical protein